ncbi:MAG TPA: hypothetical protein VNZ68_04765 [Rhodocyclaceae bacterium]|nr:hypothetical protein [Rhodocyclaceae bacterium]
MFALFIFSISSFYMWISVFRVPVTVDEYASAEAITTAASASECVALELKTRLESGIPVLLTDLTHAQEQCDNFQKHRMLVKSQAKALQDVLPASAK